MERRALDITRSAASVHAGHQGPADHPGRLRQLAMYKQSRLHGRWRSHIPFPPAHAASVTASPTAAYQHPGTTDQELAGRGSRRVTLAA
jgi:hypothetical protein